VETHPVTDWTLYGRCGFCYPTTGHPCYLLCGVVASAWTDGTDEQVAPIQGSTGTCPPTRLRLVEDLLDTPHTSRPVLAAGVAAGLRPPAPAAAGGRWTAAAVARANRGKSGTRPARLF
jgi:hypothetical protein